MLNMTTPISRLALGLACYLFTLPAFAVLIDFRDNLFNAANGQTLFSTSLGGIDFTLDTGAPDAFLTWNANTGLGIRGDLRANEIGGNENLRITFAGLVNLEQITITNLYDWWLYRETGSYTTRQGTQSFSATSSWSNWRRGGELTLTPDLIDIDYVGFQAPGRIGLFETHEYSLAALTVSTRPVAPVPLPPSFSLLCLGLAALVASTRRRSRP